MPELPDFDDLYVVSDLHMGGLPGFQILRETARLAGFIRRLATQTPERRLALVLNGDVIDTLAEDDTVKGYVAMLDAPVSGGEPKAIDGSLAIMAGGDANVFAKVKPILETMGSSVVHVGEIGAGNVTKLANQIIVALNIAAVSEGLMLARRAGADVEKVFMAIRNGLAGSTVMNAKVPMILEGNFKPGFRIDLHIKDLANALDTGLNTNTPLPLTAEVMQMMQVLKIDGEEKSDHSALMKYYEKLTGTRVRKE